MHAGAALAAFDAARFVSNQAAARRAALIESAVKGVMSLDETGRWWLIKDEDEIRWAYAPRGASQHSLIQIIPPSVIRSIRSEFRRLEAENG